MCSSASLVAKVCCIVASRHLKTNKLSSQYTIVTDIVLVKMKMILSMHLYKKCSIMLILGKKDYVLANITTVDNSQ